VDEDWLPERFSMALMSGSNYLHLRRTIRPDHPLALLHIRYFADEKIETGWSDKREHEPKTWATALGVLTMYRWACDLERARLTVASLPTRSELLAELQSRSQSNPKTASRARSLLRRLQQLRSGQNHATKYQYWVRDTFAFLFGYALKEPHIESRTSSGTERRDITFRNAADQGFWWDLKHLYGVESLLIECKNTDTLQHDHLNQTASYLGNRMGRLGILTCRRTSANDVLKKLNTFVNDGRKHILVVNDEILKGWIQMKIEGKDPTDAVADLHRSLREAVE